MNIELIKIPEPPTDLLYLDNRRLRKNDEKYLIESFETPLIGYYNWDYRDTENRIKKLYELGKRLNWNAMLDVDWSIEFPEDQRYANIDLNPFSELPEYKQLTDSKKLEMDHETLAWNASQFLHGEQGALLVSSQLVSCAPTHQAKLYASSQAFDEGRHVEVFHKYINKRVGYMYPINPYLKILLDKMLSDSRWDLKFIGMQLIVEGLALAAFESMIQSTNDPLLREICKLTKRDEARHVTFGVNFLEEYIPLLSEEEVEERAEFALEACKVMRERLINTAVPVKFLGITEDKAREILLDDHVIGDFRKLLFSNIVPNLKRVGLLTEKIRPKFNELGILEYEDLPDSGLVSLEELNKPLFDKTLNKNEEPR